MWVEGSRVVLLNAANGSQVDGAELARAVWEAQGAVLEAAKSEAQRAMDAGNKELLREISFAIQQATQDVDSRLREDLVVLTAVFPFLGRVYRVRAVMLIWLHFVP